ncbi:helix-turn-helix domain-containing protein [Actinotalea ferrariae]|uniref:helix-turn-helix domain-containing protein n=1 Tax=Actinotalea ferrariae TaxID=1386098 RepID=UPI0009DEE1A5
MCTRRVHPVGRLVRYALGAYLGLMSTQIRALVPIASRPLHERVAAVVRGEMARYEVTQARLAGVLGITQQSVSRKRAGTSPWTLDELETVAPLFGSTADELVRQARELRPVDPAGGDQWAPWGSNPQPTD